MSVAPPPCTRPSCVQQKDRLYADLLEATAEKALFCGRLDKIRSLLKQVLDQRMCHCKPSSGCSRAVMYDEIEKIVSQAL